MTIESKLETSYYNIDRDHKVIWPCETHSYARVIDVQVKQSKCLPESRPKPDPLTFTARGPQTRSRMSTSLCKKLSTYSTWCNNKLTPGYREQEDTRNYLATPSGEVIWPNWETPLRLKIMDDQVSFAETIGEWRESVQMLGGIAKLMTRAVRETKRLFRRRGSYKAWTRWFRAMFGRSPRDKLEVMDAVSVDLMVKFGINPQLGLLNDTISKLQQELESERVVRVTVPKDTTHTTYGIYSGCKTSTYKASVRVTVAMRYDADRLGFTTGNLLESVWAGTSMSFMIDWFWNLGSWLSSLTALSGITTIRGCISKKYTVRVKSDMVPEKGYVCVRKGRYTGQFLERTVITNIADIGIGALPEFHLPDYDLIDRLTSALEVLGSLRRR